MTDDASHLDLVELLLDADANGARAHVQRSVVARGVTRTVLGLLAPALQEVGDRWACGSASVASEQVATAIVGDCIASIRGASARSAGRARGRPRALTCTPSGESHELPALLVACVVEDAGWEVVHLGCDLPADHVVASVEEYGVELCLVSVTMVDHVAAATDLMARLEVTGTRVLAGGAAAGMLAPRSGPASIHVGAPDSINIAVPVRN